MEFVNKIISNVKNYQDFKKRQGLALSGTLHFIDMDLKYFAIPRALFTTTFY